MSTLAYLEQQLEAAIQDELNARRCGDDAGQEIAMQTIRALRLDLELEHERQLG